MKIYQKLSLILALGLGGMAVANAAIPLYDNTGAGSPDGTALGFFGDGYISNEFSTGSLCPSGCSLTGVSLFLSAAPGTDPSAYHLGLFNNSAGTGTALLSFNNPLSGFSTTDTLTPFTGTTSLAANTNYWLVLTGTNTDHQNYLSWDYYQTATQSVLPNQNQGLYQVDGFTGPLNGLLMKVQATPNAIPIPGAIWMMGTALIGLVSAWRKKAR